MNPLNTVKIKDGESYRIINESDFKHGLHELCEGEKLSAQPSAVSGSSTGRTKAEKLQLENTALIAELKTALDEKDQVQGKLTETESQLGVLQTENTELKAKIAELEKAAVKKPTAAELKAAKAAEDAKAAEEAKAAEQSQE